ncbi:MAG: hypothetical protein LBG88_01510 [Christensenellaceae bacterium]|nr:hypothetical protein [Christensenellaceae bacterium]
MANYIRKIFSAKRLAIFGIAVVFAITGLLGGAFAPIAAWVRANTGTANDVVSNYGIYDLPKQSIPLGTLFKHGVAPAAVDSTIPKMSGTNGDGTTNKTVALFRIENTGAVKVDHNAAYNATTGAGAYSYLGSYEWRFYDFNLDSPPADKGKDNYIHKYSVVVYQDSYSYELPTSARYARDFDSALGASKGTELSWIPNVTVPSQKIQFPLPDKFIDKKGNDLFDDEVENVIELRKAFLNGWTGRQPNLTAEKGINGPTDTTARTQPSDNAVATSTEWFKRVIWANTTITLYGSTLVGGTTYPHNDVQGAYIYSNSAANDIKARTFTPTTPYDKYYAQYQLKHNKVGARFRTDMFAVELLQKVSTTDPVKDVRENIIFKMPMALDNPLSTNALQYNQDTVLPLPTANIAPSTDIDTNKSGFKSDYKAIAFNQATTISSYTYMEVYFYEFEGMEQKVKDAAEARGEDGNAAKAAYIAERTRLNGGTVGATTYPRLRIDESNGYKFKPTLPGNYQFKYYTTTLFGAGYDYYSADPDGNPHNVIAKSGDYVTYFPFKMFTVSENTVSPGLKWTVPYAYVIPGSTGYNATTNQVGLTTAQGWATTNGLPAPEVGDAIAYLANNDLLGYKQGQIIERASDNKYFKDATNLNRYMPSSGTTPTTQLSNNDAFVFPALIGSNNAGTSKQLTYEISLTRFEVGANTRTIRFESNYSGSSTGATASTFKYYPEKPLVIGFGDGFGTGAYSPTGYLRSWNELSKTQMYQITVAITDNSPEIFANGKPGAQTAITYSFTIVDDSNFDKVKEAAPSFNGSLAMSQTAYYENDTISFREIGVYDSYTNDVEIEYYIVGGITPVKLEKENIKGGTVSIELNRLDPKMQPIFDAFTSGMLDLTVVAVAKNYWALTNQVQTNNNFAAKTVNDVEALLARQIQYPGDLTNDGADDEYQGIAVEYFDIKLFDITHGAQATIGLWSEKSPKSDGVAVGDVATTMTAYWEAWFGTFGATVPTEKNSSPSAVDYDKVTGRVYPKANATTDTNVVSGAVATGKITRTHSGATQNQKFNLPTISVEYKSAVGSNSGKTGNFITTVEFSMISPTSKTTNAVIGGTTQTMPLSVDGVDSPSIEKIDNLSFFPTEIGEHKFVAKVYNSGGFVSVMTAVINVVGTPDTVAVLRGGVSSLRIGQSGSLPWAEVFINGQSFRTDANYNVHVTGNAAKKVGTYAIKVDSVGGSPIPSNVGNAFIPVAEDRYIFTYELRLNAGALNNYFTNDLGLSGSFVGEDGTSTGIIRHTVAHTINVTGLDQNDVGIKLQEDSYIGYNGIGGGKGYTDSDGVTTGTIENFNILEQMVTSGARDVTMSMAQLNNGMTLKTPGSGGANDVYDFGRIYLPNMYAKWADALSNLYQEFDIATNSSVTVTHTKSAEPLFDSTKIKEGKETQWVTADNGGTYYYFKPLGSVSLASGADVEYTPKNLVEPSVSPDGIYTVTYTITFKGIVSTLEFYIGVGDTATPVIKFGTVKEGKDKGKDWEEILFGEEYKLNKYGWANFEFNTNDIIVDPNGGTLTPISETSGGYADWYVARKLTISVLTPGGVKNMVISNSPDDDDNVYIHKDYKDDEIAKFILDENGEWKKRDPNVTATNENQRWHFRLTESGEYRITFSIESESGVTGYLQRTITVETPASKAKIAPQTIWGTVLIIISSGLLLGVIVYFIQTGRKTKFAGTGSVTSSVASGEGTAKKFLDKFKREKGNADAKKKPEASEKKAKPSVDKPQE